MKIQKGLKRLYIFMNIYVIICLTKNKGDGNIEEDNKNVREEYIRKKRRQKIAITVIAIVIIILLIKIKIFLLLI